MHGGVRWLKLTPSLGATIQKMRAAAVGWAMLPAHRNRLRLVAVFWIGNRGEACLSGGCHGVAGGAAQQGHGRRVHGRYKACLASPFSAIHMDASQDWRCFVVSFAGDEKKPAYAGFLVLVRPAGRVAGWTPIS